MLMNPLVSILIPAYNAEKWFKATVESALAQTWPNKEIIIVNDGSTDSTFKIAKEFESKTVKVITQKNSGACVARNRALSVSQGDFIQWLDADDILAPDKIDIQLSNSDLDPQTRILHSSAWGYFFFSLKRARFVPNPLWQELTPVDCLLKHIGDGYWMYPAAWLVSRKLTDLAGPWDEKLMLNQDGEYFSRVVASSELVIFHPKARSYYRDGNLSSISRSTGSNKALESLSLSMNLSVDHFLKLECSEKTKKACINGLKKIVNRVSQESSPIILANNKRIIKLGGNLAKVSRSSKFTFVQRIIGLKPAILLKVKLWHADILVRKYYDMLLAILYGEKI